MPRRSVLRSSLRLDIPFDSRKPDTLALAQQTLDNVAKDLANRGFQVKVKGALITTAEFKDAPLAPAPEQKAADLPASGKEPGPPPRSLANQR